MNEHAHDATIVVPVAQRYILGSVVGAAFTFGVAAVLLGVGIRHNAATSGFVIGLVLFFVVLGALLIKQWRDSQHVRLQVTPTGLSSDWPRKRFDLRDEDIEDVEAVLGLELRSATDQAAVGGPFYAFTLKLKGQRRRVSVDSYHFTPPAVGAMTHLTRRLATQRATHHLSALRQGGAVTLGELEVSARGVRLTSEPLFGSQVASARGLFMAWEEIETIVTGDKAGVHTIWLLSEAASQGMARKPPADTLWLMTRTMSWLDFLTLVVLHERLHRAS